MTKNKSLKPIEKDDIMSTEKEKEATDKFLLLMPGVILADNFIEGESIVIGDINLSPSEDEEEKI